MIFFPVKKVLYVAIMGVAFFGPATVLGIWLPLANLDGSFTAPARTSIICGSFFGFLLLTTPYLFLFYRRANVRIDAPRTIAVTGAFTHRVVAVADVTRVRWRRWPRGGSVVIQSPAARVVVDFDSFAPRHALIRTLHELLPADVQDGWGDFPVPRSPFPNRHRWRPWQC